MDITCLSDCHGHLPQLEGGDLLIVAGDLTASDKTLQYLSFFEWLQTQKYRKKVFISGNHDMQAMSQFDWGEANYLLDSGTEFEGLKIWGSPWTLSFPGMNPKCKAFTVDTEEELVAKWELIPDDIDILVTHSPPYNIFDGVERYNQGEIEHCGSKSLCKWVANHCNSLKLHIFGHIHEGYGIYDIRKFQDQMKEPRTPVFVNASHVNERYRPVNKPIRIDL